MDCPGTYTFSDLYQRPLWWGRKQYVWLFADDFIIYRPIRSKKDSELIESDLGSVGSWKKTWLMHFNAILPWEPAENYMTTLSGSVIPWLYTHLKFNTHINNIAAKADNIP